MARYQKANGGEDAMSWENTLKGQEPKDDPRIQHFLSRQKPEYKLGEENKIDQAKQLNKLRMELAEKMLDQDGYINMMGFFDKSDAWRTPLSHNWIERYMFDEENESWKHFVYGTPKETFEYAKRWGGESPFYFRGEEWEDTPKKEKLEEFRDLLPSEEGGTMEPVSSKAKPTYAEEEMLGRDIFDNKDDPRKRPINPDSGTFPMGFARKPFGSDMNTKKKSWENLLLKQYKNEEG